MEARKPQGSRKADGWFVTTHWSVVLSAREKDSPKAAAALESLCRVYWYPLYAYVRQLGLSPHDAEDCVQDFFVRLLEKDVLECVAREKGKFRSFLLAALRNYLANEWDLTHTQRRGGGAAHVCIDSLSAEALFDAEQSSASAEQLYERRWALTLLEQAIATVRAEFERAGKAAVFEELVGCISVNGAPSAYLTIARKLGVSEGAARVAVHRVRRRFGEVLRQEIAQTVSSPAEIEEELRYLRRIVGV